MFFLCPCFFTAKPRWASPGVGDGVGWGDAPPTFSPKCILRTPTVLKFTLIPNIYISVFVWYGRGANVAMSPPFNGHCVRY